MIGGRERRQLLAFLALSLAGCGGGGDGPGIVNAPVVISVTVAQPSTNPIDIGGTVQLTATVEVQNGASQGVDWSSSAPNVATVTSGGLVTGVTGGTAVITATSTANRSKTGTASITVNPPRVVGVTLNSGARTIRVGENFAVAATVETRGTLAKTVAFTTSNAAIATVSSTDGLTGTVVGVGAGQATITATSTVDATKNVTLAVTVTGTARITSVTPSPATVRPGTTVKLVPTVQADPGVSTAVTFQSQNTAIATVAGDGTVTGVAVGQTTVVVRSVGDQTVSVNVPVNVRSGVTSVSLTPDRDSVRRGGSRQLALAVVADAGVSTAVNLSSANPAVATVDAAARVTGVTNGQTYIRALSTVDPSVGDSTLVTVVDPCVYFTPLVFGTTFNGTVNDLSCTGTSELFSLAVNQPSAFLMTATTQFPADFTVVGDKTGSWFTSVAAAGIGSAFVLATTNHYYARVAAQNLSARGNFSITATATPVPTAPGTCNFVATTGLTVAVPLSACGFQPTGRPAGTYNSVGFFLLPVFQTGERLTVTITAPAGVFPLVEARFIPAAATQAIGTTNSLVQSFTAPAQAYTSFVVSTRDANQTGNVTVKIEGPPSVAFDAFVFGSGVLGQPRRALPPARIQP